MVAWPSSKAGEDLSVADRAAHPARAIRTCLSQGTWWNGNSPAPKRRAHEKRRVPWLAFGTFRTIPAPATSAASTDQHPLEAPPSATQPIVNVLSRLPARHNSRPLVELSKIVWPVRRPRQHLRGNESGNSPAPSQWNRGGLWQRPWQHSPPVARFPRLAVRFSVHLDRFCAAAKVRIGLGSWASLGVQGCAFSESHTFTSVNWKLRASCSMSGCRVNTITFLILARSR